MEHIIAKLRNDFECGKMNRRQLIQSPAMAATAAGASASASAQSKGFNAVTVNHISYQAGEQLSREGPGRLRPADRRERHEGLSLSGDGPPGPIPGERKLAR
jgi:hypothetical protein